MPTAPSTVLDNTSTGLNTEGFAAATAGLSGDAAGDTFLVNHLASAEGDLVPDEVTLTCLSRT